MQRAETRSSVCPAAQVQSAIGASKACAFDLTAACSGFVLGLITASQYIRTGSAKHILLVSGDALSRFVDWRDRGETLTQAHTDTHGSHYRLTVTLA